MVNFPEIKFGRCPVCGSKGDDKTSGLTSADSTSDTDPGTGVILDNYDGKLMCEICRNRLRADAESKLAARKHSEEEKFRGKAGFKKSI
jgi:hypothetical protein